MRCRCRFCSLTDSRTRLVHARLRAHCSVFLSPQSSRIPAWRATRGPTRSFVHARPRARRALADANAHAFSRPSAPAPPPPRPPPVQTRRAPSRTPGPGVLHPAVPPRPGPAGRGPAGRGGHAAQGGRHQNPFRSGYNYVCNDTYNYILWTKQHKEVATTRTRKRGGQRVRDMDGPEYRAGHRELR